MSEEDSSDEGLSQKALFVQLPTRPIDLDTIPLDGNEFIHKSKLEEAHLFSNQNQSFPVEPLGENEQKRMRQWARKAALEFSHYALKLMSDKDKAVLKKRFPRKLTFPKNGPSLVQDWCRFCLGSKLCADIYDKKDDGSDEEVDGHLPLLSIIVHFNQYTVVTVLKHLREWFSILGMEESLGRWLYAVLACLRKPLDDHAKEVIENFYHDCKKRLKDCDESERSRLYLISAILELYFCVNLDKVGSPLESFRNLKI